MKLATLFAATVLLTQLTASGVALAAYADDGDNWSKCTVEQKLVDPRSCEMTDDAAPASLIEQAKPKHQQPVA
jgi:hypothetical protein